MKYELTGYGLNEILRCINSKKIKIFNLNFISKNKIVFEVEDKFQKKVNRIVANVNVNKSSPKIKLMKNFVVSNIGLVLGLFVGYLIAVFMSAFTWQIQVNGTKDLSVLEVEQLLLENGVKKGKINTKSAQQIEQILLENSNKIAQVSVVKLGSAIIINLSEKLVYEAQEYSPIRAKFAGVITEINITTGTNNVSVGDFVQTGDILVLPYNINQNGEKISVKPLAEIKAEFFVVEKAELSKTEIVLKPTGKKQIVYNYKLFNKKIFSGKNKNSFALFNCVVYNENVSRLVPLTRDIVIFEELKQVEIEHDFEQEKQALINKSITLANQNVPNSSTKKNQTTQLSFVGNKMFAITTITLNGVIHD